MSKDERLAESVRSYAVIYDKSHAGHKDNLQKENAWKLVAEECCIGDVKTVKRLFDNLKKRFNKRRKKVKELDVSGTSKKKIEKAKKELEELAYLFWLEPFVLMRKTKSNCSNFKTIVRKQNENATESTDDSGTEEDEDEDDTNNGHDTNNEYEENADEGSDSADENRKESDSQEITVKSGKDALLSTNVKKVVANRQKSQVNVNKNKYNKISETTGKVKWHQRDESVEDAQIKFLKTATLVLNPAEKNDPIKQVDKETKSEKQTSNDIFAKYIACEINELPDKFQRIARQRITTALFEVHAWSSEQEQPQQPSPTHYQQYTQEPHGSRNYRLRTTSHQPSPIINPLQRLSSPQQSTMSHLQSLQTPPRVHPLYHQQSFHSPVNNELHQDASNNAYDNQINTLTHDTHNSSFNEYSQGNNEQRFHLPSPVFVGNPGNVQAICSESSTLTLEQNIDVGGV